MVVLFEHGSEFNFIVLDRGGSIVEVEVTQFKSNFPNLFIIIVLVDIPVLIVKLVRTNSCSDLVSSYLLPSDETSNVSLDFDYESYLFHGEVGKSS